MEFIADAVAPLASPLAAGSTAQETFFYMFCGGIAFLLVNTVAVLAIIKSAKRSPSIESEFATKTELKDGLSRVDQQISRVDEDVKTFNTRNEVLAAQIFAEIKSGNVSMNHEFSSLNRSIGKLEGHQELALGIAEALRKS